MIYESEQVDQLQLDDYVGREVINMNATDEMIDYIRTVIESIHLVGTDEVINALALVKTANYVHNMIATKTDELDLIEGIDDTIWTVYAAYLFDLNG